MSAAFEHRWTVSSFLAWEEKQPLRHEFNGFRITAMTGGTVSHAVIGRNLARFLSNALDGTPCQFFGSDLKIEAAGSVRYPDGIVVCTKVPGGSTVVRDPVVIFEVLSESTAETDRTEKMEEYRATPSVRRYVMLEQNHMLATVFAREGERWVGSLVRGGEALAMPEIGVTLPLDDLYRDVDLADPRAASDPEPRAS